MTYAHAHLARPLTASKAREHGCEHLVTHVRQTFETGQRHEVKVHAHRAREGRRSLGVERRGAPGLAVRTVGFLVEVGEQRVRAEHR